MSESKTLRRFLFIVIVNYLIIIIIIIIWTPVYAIPTIFARAGQCERAKTCIVVRPVAVDNLLNSIVIVIVIVIIIVIAVVAVIVIVNMILQDTLEVG